MSIKPIFLLSLPRAGSTLLQRLLSQHGEISTQPEPWIALPLFFALKEEGVSSIYGHRYLAKAVTGFADSLPNGKEDYYSGAASFLTRMYSHGSEDGGVYFLDKTPRYHLIVDELMRAFPDGKFIFLWRNPLAISASMIKTWGKGKWNLYMFWVDLYSGIDSLINAYTRNSKRSIAVKYEDLVTAPDEQMKKIMTYLDLEEDINIVESFRNAKKMNVSGRGDPTGQYKYDAVSQGSMSAWKEVLRNPFRKAWSMKYLDWMGRERLNIMGYDIDHLKSEIRSQRYSYEYFFSDYIRNIYGKIYCKYSTEKVEASGTCPKNIIFSKN